MIRFAHITLTLLALAAPALAQCPGRCPAPPQLRVGDVIQLGYQQPEPVRPSPQSIVTRQVPQAPSTNAPVAATADPYGFVSWLNAARHVVGRGPVVHDPNLSAWAAANNRQQRARGMGHYVMGPARRQNVGYGGGVWNAWLYEPPSQFGGMHRDALLDASIRFVGIAFDGVYWTFDAR